MSYLSENLSVKVPLRFKNGKFKVLCISDLHGVVDFDTRILRDLSALLDSVKPDLLLILGDLIWRDAMDSEENMKRLRASIAQMEANGGTVHEVNLDD